MKLISLNEARDRLGEYGTLCLEEAVIVHVDGIPKFQLAPLDEDDDFLNRLIESNPQFRLEMAQRTDSTSVSAEEALRMLDE